MTTNALVNLWISSILYTINVPKPIETTNYSYILPHFHVFAVKINAIFSRCAFTTSNRYLLLLTLLTAFFLLFSFHASKTSVSAFNERLVPYINSTHTVACRLASVVSTMLTRYSTLTIHQQYTHTHTMPRYA